MPPPASFDYYAELQVERSATVTEITSAYRRLARIHHPDKNPHNQQEATAIFQRLQLAHETLSDPVKRNRYDDGDDDILYEPDDSDPFEFDAFTSTFYAQFFFFFGMTPAARRAAAQAAERQRREDEAEVKREAERQRQDAKEAREKEAKMKEALAKRRLHDEEVKKQDKRWQEKGAVSKDEKMESCLHSELCEKFQHTRKFKCTACSVKRGMTAFECPHCSASLCMLCVKTFSERRKRMEKKDQMAGTDVPEESPGTSGEPASKDHDANESDINEVNTNDDNANEWSANQPDANEPTIRTPATKSHEKKKPKTKNANTNGSSKQPPISSKSTNRDKNNGPVLSEVNENQAPPHPGAPFASDNPYDILTEDDKSTDRADPSHDSTRVRTGGFIRTLSKIPMPSAAILRQAMEKFGTVRYLKVTNKKFGVAHVGFATHDGLSRAMAASPVSVSETVKVRVAELKHCHTCGKDGHNAETCRAVPRKTQGAA